MELRFPLKDVKVELTVSPMAVASPLYSDGFFILNQNELSMDVDGVARYYVSDGNFVSVFPFPGADINTIELYLNGSAYGAILHQRKILPLHGSCFKFKDIGIMICGDSGAGKSSVTASFCLNGAEFLTDDVTPVLFTNGKPYIWALSDRIKLWQDSLMQLDQDHSGLDRIDKATKKFYYPIASENGVSIGLNRIYVIEIHDIPDVEFLELTGASKFIALRKEIYRLEYLQGMPENEKVYLSNLADISNNARIFIVKRPADMKIISLTEKLENQICQS